ncbi:MAG TPA: IPT/TIG domain-containing protein, partial [Myxococcota bacterium]|nr:IPT/TIG domain-containing protein [Myxococcota bacterium]
IRPMTVTGEGFLSIAGTLPVVRIGEVELTASSASNCRALPAPTEDVQTCTSLQVDVPIAGVPEGLHQVVAVNPDPAGCESTQDIRLRIVPEPTVGSALPDLACVAQAEKQFVVAGTGFLVVDGTLPTVSFGAVDFTAAEASGCTELDGLAYAVRSCTELRVAVPAGGVEPGTPTVRVTNPPTAGCVSEQDVRVQIVPPPTLLAAAPDIVCLEQSQVVVSLSGTGFIDHNGVLPTVHIGPLSLPADGLEGCEVLEVPAGTVQSCTGLTVTVAQAGLEPGAYAISVTNPPEADCTSGEAVSLAVVAGPTLTGASPELFCAEQAAVEVTVSGTGFLRIDAQLPVVVIGAESFPASSVGDCVPVVGTLADAESCQQLVFSVTPAVRQTGWTDLTVRNPAPADCETTAASQLFLLGAPIIEIVSPSIPCEQNPTEFAIRGSRFLELDGAPPTVTLAGQAAAVTGLEDCAAVPGLATTRLCGLIRAQVANPVAQGDYAVTVLDPGEHACITTATATLGPPPQIASIEPVRLCASGGTFTVHGSNFVEGAVVSIESQAGLTRNLATQFVDAQTLIATLPDGSEPGLYDVIVTNPDGCTGALLAILDVTHLPVVYFVDPSFVYNGINLQVTVYTSGILGSVDEVIITPTLGGLSTALEFNAADTSEIQAVIPSGLPPGEYDIRVVDDIGCVGDLVSGLTLVETLSVAVESVELPFGWKDGRTGVNVYASANPDVGMTNFQATPRFYLNPKDAGPDALASELTHTAYASATRCSAVVPAGMPIGMYDLVALNPDGGVGLLVDAFRVTELPPPVITELLPSSVVNQGTPDISVAGLNFRLPAFEATCHQPDGTQVLLPGSVDTNLSTDTLLVVGLDFNATAVADNSLCIVKVTNGDDQTYALYSALGVTNLSLNLEHFQDSGQDMNTARRALCGAAGDPTPGSRFVYALGGDNGLDQASAATERYDTIEAASMDPYGQLEGWNVLRYTLPAAVSFQSCTTLGRYVFVAGGRDADGTRSSVWRAKILDPLEAPEIVDLDLFIDPDPYQPAGLEPGRYSYRVSAIFPVSDTDNPDGEDLASDPIQVQTPDIERKVTITLVWTEVPGASGYRVYRTPTPNLPTGNEVLLAEVGAGQLVFSDDGSLAPQAAQPLPAGSLGKFLVLPSLNVPREGAGIAVARDPADASVRYLYVLGGQNAGVALDSVERLRVVVDGAGQQTIDPVWVDGLATLGPARWQFRAFVADHLSAPEVVGDTETWLYVGGGLRADLAKEATIYALKVEAGGSLGELGGDRYEVDTMQPFNAGYCGYLLNHQLFAFGGNQGAGTAPSLESYSCELCGSSVSPGAGACSNGIPDPPDTANWNSIGIDLAFARYLHDGVVTSAFIVMMGGITLDPVSGLPVVTATTEKTLW